MSTKAVDKAIEPLMVCRASKVKTLPELLVAGVMSKAFQPLVEFSIATVQ